MREEFIVRHSSLGELIGLQRDNNVVQLRGIPFASIPKRFAQSRIRTALPQSPFDARYPGPICPQPDLPYPQYWNGPLPSSFPVLPLPPASEFDCLNLNITVPRYLLAPEQSNLKPRVPVLVFFHGGALAGGSQSIQIAGREIYDPTSLVRASLSRNQAIIVVTANYRVGPLGFLASAQLVEENLASGPAGNYGLHDQRRALEWCRRFIAGFGGDSENITIQGSSAGGLSCHYHCLHPSLRKEDLHERDGASEPGARGETLLFRRAIVASGSFISNRPMPLEHHQQVFDAYIQNLPSEDTKDSLTTLRKILVDELLSHVPVGVRWHPFADQAWLREDILRAYQEAVGPKPDIMIGAARYELEVIEGFLSSEGKPLQDEAILSRVSDLTLASSMPLDFAGFPASYPSIISNYELDQPSSKPSDLSRDPYPLKTPSLAFDKWAELLGDLTFRIPPIYFALYASKAAPDLQEETNTQQQLTGRDVFVYSIHATNPFPRWPKSYRRANHAINDIFVFDVAGDLVPSGEKNIAEDEDGTADLLDEYRGAVSDIQSAWIRFCHGIRPWRAFNGHGHAHGGAKMAMGPVYVFKNNGESREYASVREAEGARTEEKWMAVLEAAGVGAWTAQ